MSKQLQQWNKKQNKKLQAQGQERLQQFMPRLLRACAEVGDPDLALERLLPLVVAVVRRSAYLVLLMENPAALQELVVLGAASPWIAEQMARHPVLLDEFLDSGSLSFRCNSCSIQVDGPIYQPPHSEGRHAKVGQEGHVPEQLARPLVEIAAHGRSRLSSSRAVSVCLFTDMPRRQTLRPSSRAI